MPIWSVHRALDRVFEAKRRYRLANIKTPNVAFNFLWSLEMFTGPF
jgi:hypothetical protein